MSHVCAHNGTPGDKNVQTLFVCDKHTYTRHLRHSNDDRINENAKYGKPNKTFKWEPNAMHTPNEATRVFPCLSHSTPAILISSLSFDLRCLPLCRCVACGLTMCAQFQQCGMSPVSAARLRFICRLIKCYEPSAQSARSVRCLKECAPTEHFCRIIAS